MSLTGRRLAETLAMMMIGDSVLALAAPRGHAGLWLRGPSLWRWMVKPFAGDQGLTRTAGAAGLVAGLALGLWAEGKAREAAETVQSAAAVGPIGS